MLFLRYGTLFLFLSLFAYAEEEIPEPPVPEETVTPKREGIILGFSPIFHPKLADADQLGHGASTSFLLGYRVSEALDVQFRFQGGTIPTFRLSDSTRLTDMKAKLFSVGLEYNVPLNDPFDGFYGFQFVVPINIAGFANIVSTPGRIYTNVGLSAGPGAGVRYYTGSYFVFDATFVYHFSLPFGDIESTGALEKPVNASGDPIKGSTAGPELRLSVTLLL